jgi:hypothetical protein
MNLKFLPVERYETEIGSSKERAIPIRHRFHRLSAVQARKKCKALESTPERFGDGGIKFFSEELVELGRHSIKSKLAFRPSGKRENRGPTTNLLQ